MLNEIANILQKNNIKDAELVYYTKSEVSGKLTKVSINFDVSDNDYQWNTNTKPIN